MVTQLGSSRALNLPSTISYSDDDRLDLLELLLELLSQLWLDPGATFSAVAAWEAICCLFVPIPFQPGLGVISVFSCGPVTHFATAAVVELRVAARW
jgi:hypothetical protein